VGADGQWVTIWDLGDGFPPDAPQHIRTRHGKFHFDHPEGIGPDRDGDGFADFERVTVDGEWVGAGKVKGTTRLRYHRCDDTYHWTMHVLPED